jgi:hypothetical protein
MTKQELLAVLNEDALSLGIAPITIRQLSDWVDDGLIERAQPKGVRRGINPDWQFSETSEVRARLVVKSISAGSSRKTEHRIFVWAHRHDYSFDLIHRAIVLEFGRFLKRQRRKLEWQYDHRNRVQPKKRERFLRQIPDLDDELKKAGLDQPPDALLRTMSEAYWGPGKTEVGLKILSENMAGQFGISAEQIAQISSKIALAGLLGNHDEIDASGLAILKNANENDLVQGRANFQSFLSKIDQLNSVEGFHDDEKLGKILSVIPMVSNSIFRPDWMISTIAAMVIAAHKFRKGIG